MQDRTLGELSKIWAKILRDPDARRAMKILKRDGFEISHLVPQDASMRHPNWADEIAAIPLLPNRSARRRIHHRSTLRKHWPLLRVLRRLAKKMNDPFSEVSIVSMIDSPVREIHNLGKHVEDTANIVEKVLSWDWYVRDRNPRNSIIAELRWQIRWRTGRPHDLELATLIDAAFRAAGVKDGLLLDATTLDRIEKREKEVRVKATRRLLSRSRQLSP